MEKVAHGIAVRQPRSVVGDAGGDVGTAEDVEARLGRPLGLDGRAAEIDHLLIEFVILVHDILHMHRGNAVEESYRVRAPIPSL